MTRSADDENVKKELQNLLSAQAATHLDATYLCAPVIRLSTLFYFVDPMHCLQLNIAKTL
eukprot:1606948-Pleurochrysis_carterae.AAC.1